MNPGASEARELFSCAFFFVFFGGRKLETQ